MKTMLGKSLIALGLALLAATAVAAQTRTVDANIQLDPGWGTHCGGVIGGVCPDSYGFTQQYNNTNWMYFFTEYSGSGYADWEAYLGRPIYSNTGNLQMDFDLMVDSNASKYAQALEFDSRLTDSDGYNYNFSSQIDYSKGGAFEISDQTGHWVQTGYVPGILTANRIYHFTYVYQFNTTTKKYSFISADIYTQSVTTPHPFMIPSNLQNLTAQDLGWKTEVIVQIQQDLVDGGGTYSHQVNNLQYTWY